MNASIDTLRQQLKQLQALHAAGTLGDEAFTQARDKIEREIVDRVMAGEVAPAAAPPSAFAPPSVPAPPRPSRRLTAGLFVGVLALAVAGYSVTGSPGRAGLGGADPAGMASGPADASGAPVTNEQVAEIVERLAERLKERPDDAVGWTLLARAYAAMGRNAEALPAFRKALDLAGEQPDLMADYADTLAAENNGKLDDEALGLVERALELEPGNVKALALSGSAAYDNADYATAVSKWERVERALPRDSRLLPQVQASIAQARSLGGLPAAAPSAAPAAPVERQAATAMPGAVGAVGATGAMGAASAPGAPSAASTATAVSGTVSLGPALVSKASPDDTVYVVARAASGPRMPLAVLRKQVKDLPLDFMLDDSMAMAPNARLSDQAQVVVSARISKSGDALPQPGDLAGQSVPVAPGASGVAVRISEVFGQ